MVKNLLTSDENKANILSVDKVSLASMSKLSWPKKNLNNFRTEAATRPGFAPLESSRRSG